MWIDLEGLANLRDVGGLPTDDGGTIAPGRLLRSDNLQTLTDADQRRLLALGLTDVIDLRSGYEAEQEGPGPLSASGVRIQQFSLFREWRAGCRRGQARRTPRGAARGGVAVGGSDARGRAGRRARLDLLQLPAGASRLGGRPRSGRSRAAPGAALVHCAAGKDRTGTIVALALSVAGAQRDAIVADYAATLRTDRADHRPTDAVRRPMSTTSAGDRCRRTSPIPRP